MRKLADVLQMKRVGLRDIALIFQANWAKRCNTSLSDPSYKRRGRSERHIRRLKNGHHTKRIFFKKDSRICPSILPLFLKIVCWQETRKCNNYFVVPFLFCKKRQMMKSIIKEICYKQISFSVTWYIVYMKIIKKI